MSKLLIGWSEISITPDKKISLSGQFAERISQYVEKPLMATAMAVEAGGDQMVLVGCDLAAIGGNLCQAVRKNLAEKVPDLDPEKVLISAIHTHTGPVYTSYGQVASRSFRALLEQELPQGRKYIESAPVSDNPDIASADEVLELLVEQLAFLLLFS